MGIAYATKIVDRDFDDILKDAISSAGGKNAKAIRALLDFDALKASKNQKEDVAAAIKKLTEAEDSAFLFTKDNGDGADDASDDAQKLGILGIIQYNGFVHVDSRTDRYWARDNNGNVSKVVAF